MATLEADMYQLFIPLMHHFWNMGDVILYNQIYGTNGITHTRSRNGTGSGNVTPSVIIEVSEATKFLW